MSVINWYCQYLLMVKASLCLLLNLLYIYDFSVFDKPWFNSISLSVVAFLNAFFHMNAFNKGLSSQFFVNMLQL